MKKLGFSIIALAAGLLIGAPAFAQSTSAGKQKTDGNSPTDVGPGSAAYKQHTDGSSPTDVGPGSGAYKPNTK